MLLATWNMQGGNKWSAALGAFKTLKADVMCLQECGSAPIDLKAIKNLNNTSAGVIQLGTQTRSLEVNIAHYAFGNNNDRCSLAVVSYEVPKNYCLITHYSGGIRPLLGVELSSGLWVFSIHAPSSGGAAGVAQALLSTINENAWVCAGDYNCDPSKITKFAVSSSGKKTQQSGNELDYATFWNCKVSCNGVLNLMSDHWAVSFDVT